MILIKKRCIVCGHETEPTVAFGDNDVEQIVLNVCDDCKEAINYAKGLLKYARMSSDDDKKQ